MEIPEKIIECLPHGSGIDCEWTYKEKKDYIVFSNSFHVMNDNGYYIGYIDFSVILKENDFKLVFHTNSCGYRIINNYALRDYLEDTIYYCLKEKEII